MKAISLFVLSLVLGCSSKQPKSDSIRHALLGKVGTTRQCYLESDSFFKKQTITFKHQHKILSDGSTKDHQIIEPDFKDPNFSSCFLTQMKSLQYELPLVLPEDNSDEKILLEPTGNIQVIQPFNFAPST